MSEMVLRLPSCYVDIERDEMEYVDGGATSDRYYSASTGSNWLGGQAATYVAIATGYGYAAAAGLVTAGIGTVIGLVGGGYSGFLAAIYTSAYNDAQDIKADYGSSARVRIRTTTLFGAITKVSIIKV
jgi:hypothetical protein